MTHIIIDEQVRTEVVFFRHVYGFASTLLSLNNDFDFWEKRFFTIQSVGFFIKKNYLQMLLKHICEKSETFWRRCSKN